MSQEKELPPTAQHLRQLARKGRFPTAPEFRTGVQFVTALLAVAVLAPPAIHKMAAVSQHLIDRASDREPLLFDHGFFAPLSAAAVFFLTLGMIAACILVLTAVMETGVFGFFAENVRLDFQRINPVSGLKNIFGLPALKRIVFNIAEAVLISFATAYVLLSNLRSLLDAPSCGISCVGGLAVYLLGMLLALVAVIYLVFGALDLKISRVVFRHENKMSHSDVKRERKDTDGSPEIKAAMADARYELMSSAPMRRERVQEQRQEQQDASIVLLSDKEAVALRYQTGGDSAPVLIWRGPPSRVASLLATAPTTKVARNPEVVDHLASTPIGSEIPPALYPAVSRAMEEAGLTL
ncbi:hypothetical protein SLNSH_14680 [Alsobacter soli]|uniref:EscU/YscU/HrcU family type III secretion system export apparatus switch protein n=1 Tax=Alsobacter soli TaxID=2109933 RepID=A0A2T1HRG9_9HYPH|nr:EscU/YscU/HrcU family type III secretion system export apparatus switch protein [Alsobacter soli]PSC04236.1 hypothetical protein SLNSH_14680 [Alsobacter soli]